MADNVSISIRNKSDRFVLEYSESMRVPKPQKLIKMASLPRVKPENIVVERLSLMIWVLTVTLFIPLMVGADFHLRDTPQEVNSKSVETKMFAVAALSVCLALLFDLILDYLNVEDHVYKYFGLRTFSLVSLGSFSLAYIVAANFDNFGQIAATFDTAQLFGEVGCLLWLLNSLDSLGCFTQLRVGCILSLYYFNFLLWYLNFIYNSGDTSALLYLLSSVCYYATVISFLSLCTVYTYYMRKEMIQNHIDGKPLKLENYYCNIVVGCVVVAVILKSCLVFVISALYNTDDATSYISSPYRDGAFIIRTALTFFLCLLPGRMFKRRAAETNYDNEVKSSFVSYMSHEMRTPLNVVELGLTLLSTQIQEGCETVTLVSTMEEVEQACSEATVVLDNLLLYEKLDKNTLKLKKVKVFAVSFLYLSLEAIQKQTKPIQARLKVLPDTNTEDLTDLQIMVDKVLLSAQMLKIVKRALHNATEGHVINIRMQVLEEPIEPALVGNTGKASSVHPSSDCGLLRISITLATPLSEEEKLMFIEGKLQFKREVNDGDGGSALSMWLAKKSVTLHGGRLGFARGEDGGECLCMDLPFERAPMPMLALELKSLQIKFAGMMLLKSKVSSHNSLFSTFGVAPLNRARSEKPKLRLSMLLTDPVTSITPPSKPEVPKRLLVVDDSEMNRKMVTRLMNSLGYSCDEAEDGCVAHQKVVEALQKGVSYEFVLMDNEMPVMRGRDAVRKMRESGYNSIVLGVTGNAKDEEVADFKCNGASDVIIKPMTLPKLTEVMRKLNYQINTRISTKSR